MSSPVPRHDRQPDTPALQAARGISDRITNEVKGVNRAVYDVNSPGTIEWENKGGKTIDG
ncbi:hypothetical protein UZ36_07195 [Candidatus Nitromaritima sp. SCGC AAA799-C22]|nr:hypothetical protein UZ36_07195 [Candidatus Nitromaritima sp. SCGC AAA799-C22]